MGARNKRLRNICKAAGRMKVPWTEMEKTVGTADVGRE